MKEQQAETCHTQEVGPWFKLDQNIYLTLQYRNGSYQIHIRQLCAMTRCLFLSHATFLSASMELLTPRDWKISEVCRKIQQSVAERQCAKTWNPVLFLKINWERKLARHLPCFSLGKERTSPFQGKFSVRIYANETQTEERAVPSSTQRRN